MNNNFSMILQAIMDSKTRFIDVFTGFLGFVHYSCVLSCSNYKLYTTNGKRLNAVTKEIQSINAHEFIISDAGTRQAKICLYYGRVNSCPFCLNRTTLNYLIYVCMQNMHLVF